MDAPSESGSVTVWLHQLKAGDPAAAKPLWDGCFGRLVALARTRLGARSRAAADEEDVALSAFHSFCRAVAVGRLPHLDDRDDLWQVLFILTARKAVGLIRHENREKRGGGQKVFEIPDALTSAEPSPDLAAEVADECSRLLDCLPSEQLRQVAIWKLEGYSNAEIAVKLDRAIPTVEKKLAAIRTIWEREGLR